MFIGQVTKLVLVLTINLLYKRCSVAKKEPSVRDRLNEISEAVDAVGSSVGRKPSRFGADQF